MENQKTCSGNVGNTAPVMVSSDLSNTITNVVLLTLFPELCRLDEFLERNLEDTLQFRFEDDTIEYKELLHSTLVATTASVVSTNTTAGTVGYTAGAAPSFPKGIKPDPDSKQNDIVDMAIEQTCPRSRSWFHEPFNILAAGHVNPRSKDEERAEQFFTNTLETFVRSDLWEILLQRIGDTAMLYLLTNTSMFAALPNNCYCQITGPAISELSISKRPIRRQLLKSLSSRKRSVSSTYSTNTSTNLSSSNKSEVASDGPNASAENTRVSKRRRTEPATITPPAITFKRFKVFYAKQYHTESTMLCHFLLSNYNAAQPASSVSQPCTENVLLQRMFPRQYSLENVFALHIHSAIPSFGGSQASSSSKNAASFTGERKSKMKPTWRLRAMRKLVGDMVDLNSRCMFKHLMQYYCPVEAIDNPSHTSDMSSATLLKCNSSFDQVTSFVHAVVKKVIPLPMFGSIENRTVILRAMTRFIRLRRYETMSLQYVLQGFKMGDCEWLQDTQVRKLGSYVRHVPPSASIKQHEILYEFVYWLFDGFLISLLQAGFYITDSSFQRNKVFYYRHGLWRHITKPAVNLIQKNMFVKMTEDEVAWCYRGYSVVRLLPKEEGLRPIINLRKTSTRLVNGRPTSGVKSMNKQLMNAFLVMAYEQNRQLSYKSSSAIGMSDLYHRLKLVKNKLVDKSNMQVQRLFMVKVDIKKSFDSINQDKLLEIINNTLKEDQYMIHRYSKVMPANGAITKRFFPKAISQNEMPKFMDFSHNQAVISKHAVYIDKVIHTFERKGAIVNAIKNHIKENIVKFGRHFYRQTTGIPQGSILSPSLCRFFYDEMEKNILSELIQDMDSAMVRLADDFLFISRKQERATSFLQTMSMGHPDFGCFINETKTIANFDITMNGKVIPRCHGNEFPFCGMLLHSKTLEIRTDYSRYHGEDIRNLLTVGRDLHPGRSITFKMKKAMQHMCQMAFSDTTFNSHSKVMLNIYQNFVFCAMKFHAYCQELYLDPVSKEHLQPLALPSVVFGILRACYGLLHNGRRSTVGITAGVRFDIAERHVHWFGASAFCSTLPKLIIYDPLRVALQDKVLAPLNRDEKVHFKRMLHSVVNDQRNSILDDIRYK